MHAVIFIGIQASGKTSFYRERFSDTHIRLSLDMLRTRTRERILIDACLRSKQPFVLDNTNAAARERARTILAARAAGFRVSGYYFLSTVKESIARDLKRAQANGRPPLPPSGIGGTFKRLEPPTFAEGFHELYQVHPQSDGTFLVQPIEPA